MSGRDEKLCCHAVNRSHMKAYFHAFSLVLITYCLFKLTLRASPVVLVVPANAVDTRNTGLILGQEDPLEEGMAAPSSILA